MAKVSEDMDIPMCPECARLFDENDFYKIGRSYLPICKDCCEKKVLNQAGEFGQEELYNFLRYLDRPFYYDLFQNAKKVGKPYFKNYLDGLISSQKISKKFKNGETYKNNENLQAQSELSIKWGVADTEDLVFLEDEYHDWETSYEIDSKAMVDSVKQLCLVELDIRKTRQKGDIMALDKLLRIKSQILGDANLKPVQETGNSNVDQISIGLLIKKLENERPIPEITEPDWIDEMKMWIVGQLARMEGLRSDVSDDFENELHKYEIDTGEQNET